nr:CHC2 zinc finger domain-containing protein [Sphingomonas endophytica]
MYQSRIDAIRARVDIADVIGAVVKLGRGAKPRGTCPFHGSKSDSFAVDPAHGRARCWGCQWSGDAIKFVCDFYGLTFREAVERLEGEHGLNGLNGLTAAPLRRRKVERVRSDAPTVDSTTFGRFLWDHARPDCDAVRTYLLARGVPAPVLTDDRLRDLRFLGMAPIAAWRTDRPPSSMPQAPAIVALVRRVGCWTPIGVHVTFLRPDLGGKMVRQRGDGTAYPDRKMLGEVRGGAVVLGRPRDVVPLFEGEGLETTLSGMALGEATADACGLAALSLDNMQGQLVLGRNSAWPLYDPRVNPAAPGVAFTRTGPVTALIDADMKPLRGPRDPRTGQFRGVPVIERRRGPIVWRAVTQAERAAVCSALVVQSWRAAGCHARAVRPRMGQDFNDAVREAGT